MFDKSKILNDKPTECVVRWLFFLLVALCFVSFFSYSTSPFYSGIGDNPDSVIFQLIGKYWSEGYIPYKYLWDLKGPYIFFVNALGYAMTGSRTGVYLIQVVSLTITHYFTYQTIILSVSRRYAYILTVLSLLPLSYIYEGGNLTEEYLLPFLSLSFYFIIRWLSKYENTDHVCHSPAISVAYGLTFALCLFSRLTNALSLSAAIAVISLLLVSKKQYANFLINILAFFLGFAAVALPFVIYFWHNDALSDMLKATLVYPYQYASNASQNIHDVGIHHFFLSYINSIALLLMVVIIIFIEKTPRTRTCIYLFSSLFPLIWFCQGNGYGHYGMTVFPLYALIVIELSLRRYKKALLLFCIVISIGFCSKVRYMSVIRKWQNPNVTDCHQFLHAHPEVDYSSFVAYNCDPHVYFDMNVRPASSFFCLQDFVVSRIPDLKEELIQSYTTNHVRWILLSFAQMPLDQVIIRDMLNRDYELVTVEEDSKLILFCKKDYFSR